MKPNQWDEPGKRSQSNFMFLSNDSLWDLAWSTPGPAPCPAFILSILYSNVIVLINRTQEKIVFSPF